MPATARATGSTTQPPSRAADQIVAIPQPGPQTRGTASASSAAPCGGSAAGQCGSRRSRRPDGARARRSLQNSDTIVTMVHPTCSGAALARLTSASAKDRRPFAVFAVGGMPSQRHTDTKSEAIARSRPRTNSDSGHRMLSGLAVAESIRATTSPPEATRFRAADDFCTASLALRMEREGGGGQRGRGRGSRGGFGRREGNRVAWQLTSQHRPLPPLKTARFGGM